MSDETILQEAQRLVHGDRGDDYGHPILDFTRSGRMWGAILGIPDVPPEKVAMCMIAVKLSREVNRNKRDNRVDMAGYAETLDMVRQRQAEPKSSEEYGLKLDISACSCCGTYPCGEPCVSKHFKCCPRCY